MDFEKNSLLKLVASQQSIKMTGWINSLDNEQLNVIHEAMEVYLEQEMEKNIPEFKRDIRIHINKILQEAVLVSNLLDG